MSSFLLGYIPRIVIAGSFDNAKFSILANEFLSHGFQHSFLSLFEFKEIVDEYATKANFFLDTICEV